MAGQAGSVRTGRDLVFVFALTQVTALMAVDLSVRGLVQGAVLLGLLWWCWEAFAWLGSVAKADEGIVRVGVLFAVLGVFLIALAIPRGFGGDGKAGSILLAGAIALVWITHLVIYWLVTVEEPGTRGAIVGLARPVLIGLVPLFVGAGLGGDAQLALWALAVLIPFVGVFVVGTGGWLLTTPRYFAERHGLIIIVALGESIVALGVPASELDISARLIAAILLGLTICVMLWWAYFDVAAKVAERALSHGEGRERIGIAQVSYTYLHLPMLAGIVYLALGLKKVITYTGDPTYGLDHPLPVLAGVALFGGTALYLLAHILFRWRNTHSYSQARVIVAAGLLVTAPLAGQLPALAAVGLVAGSTLAMVAYETRRFAEQRRMIRDGGEEPAAEPR